MFVILNWVACALIQAKYLVKDLVKDPAVPGDQLSVGQRPHSDCGWKWHLQIFCPIADLLLDLEKYPWNPLHLTIFHDTHSGNLFGCNHQILLQNHGTSTLRIFFSQPLHSMLQISCGRLIPNLRVKFVGSIFLTCQYKVVQYPAAFCTLLHNKVLYFTTLHFAALYCHSNAHYCTIQDCSTCQ